MLEFVEVVELATTEIDPLTVVDVEELLAVIP